MFGFGKQSKIDSVYKLLNKRMVPRKKSAEELFSRVDIEDFLYMSGDVNTSVEMMLLFEQATFAERFVGQAPYEKIVEELIEVAKQRGVNAEVFVTEEGNVYVEDAKIYSENVARMLDEGKIVSNYEVRKFCADQATKMLSRWMVYRLNLQSAYQKLVNESAP